MEIPQIIAVAILTIRVVVGLLKDGEDAGKISFFWNFLWAGVWATVLYYGNFW